MNSPTAIRVRISRFIDERYQYRDRPGYFMDVVLWGVTVLIALWPMFTLIHAMELVR